jgi:hypothetical protein
MLSVHNRNYRFYTRRKWYIHKVQKQHKYITNRFIPEFVVSGPNIVTIAQVSATGNASSIKTSLTPANRGATITIHYTSSDPQVRVILKYELANLLQHKDNYNLIYWHFDTPRDLDYLRVALQRSVDISNLVTFPNATVSGSTITTEQRDVKKSRDGFTTSMAFAKIRTACQFDFRTSDDPNFTSSVVLWTLGACFLAYVGGAITVAYFYGMPKMIRCICCCLYLFGSGIGPQEKASIKADEH